MLEKIKLCDDVYSEVARAAEEDLQFFTDEIFFFGQIFDDYPFAENDDDIVAICPICGNVISLKEKPKNKDKIECSNCNSEGLLVDFHDENALTDDDTAIYIACLESLDKGYVLRLFKTGLDYSNRDHSDYTTLSYYPNLFVTEIGREFWYNGKVEYYQNVSDTYDKDDFVLCDKLEDHDYYIIDYDCDKYTAGTRSIIDSQYVSDILYELGEYKSGTNFIEYISKHLSFRTFNTLKRYGFHQLAKDYIYYYEQFPDSNKISEVLGVDYNQLKAYGNIAEIEFDYLNSARQLATYGIKPTEQNIEIMLRLKTEILGDFNAQKTFKYIRNLMNRLNSEEVASDYCDYITDCLKLGYDLSSSEIRYPSKFMDKHAQYAVLVSAEKDRIAEKDFLQALKKHVNISKFQNKKHIVCMAQSPTELKIEGKILHHCVGTYVDRVRRGDCIIFFIRNIDEPNTPYYTLEYDPIENRIVQCRGLKNRSYMENKDIVETMSEWLEWVKSKQKADKRKVA